MANQKQKSESVNQRRMMLCDNLSFAASEAYKLLRTNLIFSLPENGCRIIGVTSAVRDEGKSTTSVNLCYSLAEAGKRVLLIEADMRLPNIAGNLGLKASPGLSNLLAGLTDGVGVLQTSSQFKSWKILTAGDIPPNPSELLASKSMQVALESFAKGFDFIVLDLPPVNVVSDALVVSKMTDGMILVVREDFSSKNAVRDAINNFNLSDAKLLGIVMTHVNSKSSRKKYYRRKNGYGYGKGYGYGYGYGYERAGKTSTPPSSKNG